MERFRQDLRVAIRSICRAPAFFVTAVAIMALGIGMSVAMFTVFRTVLVRRLPVADQDRTVVLWTYRSDPSSDFVTGTKDLTVVRRESHTMGAIAGVAHWPATATPFRYGEQTVSLERGMVTGNFFDVLGVRPSLGRLMTDADDEAPGSTPGESHRSLSLVLSYHAWQQAFGGDSMVIGRHLVEPLLGIDYTIVGVASAGFDYPAHADYWIPMWSGWGSDVSAFAVARLNPGATPTAARDEYLAIEQRLEPKLNLRGASVSTFGEIVLGNSRPVLLLLTVAVALLLATACINVGGLSLLRASGRAREIAVRRALGAEYGDIVWQLFAESTVIAVAGGVLGLGLAMALVRMLVAFAPPSVPRLDDVALSGAPVALAILVSGVAVLIFGIGPALVAARGDVSEFLRLDRRSGGETRRRRRTRQTLVATQVALAVVMLAGAGLLTRSLTRLETQDGGYVSEHLSILSYTWDARRFDSVSRMLPLGERLARRIQEIPGISAATQMVTPPLLGNSLWQMRPQTEGQTAAEAERNPNFAAELAGSQFFKTFGIRLMRGRAFDPGDDANGPLVAIVSESAARRLWPGQDPIGKRMRLPGANKDGFGGGDGWRTVVGVARDVNLRTIREASPTIYFPSVQGYWQGSIAIRSTVPLVQLVTALRDAGHEVDPSLGLWQHDTMDALLDEPLAQPRLGAMLMSAFGGASLILAALGLYGLIASLVRDQTRELAIRIALGASSARVSREVVGPTVMVMATGVAIGLAGCLVATRLITVLLFQVRPADPVALGGACIALLMTGAAAAIVPTRRAIRIEPASALRSD